jgi:hypothetical protein
VKTAKDIRNLLKEECGRFSKQTAFAAELGISQSALSEVMSGWKRPSKRIAKYFGYVPVTMYVPQEEFSEFGDDE